MRKTILEKWIETNYSKDICKNIHDILLRFWRFTCKRKILLEYYGAGSHILCVWSVVLIKKAFFVVEGHGELDY